MLLDHSTRHALARWRVFGRCYHGMLVIERGDVETGLRLLRAAFAEPGAAGNAARLIAFLISAASGHAGQIADGLAAVEEGIEQSERTEERWLIAELLRIVLFARIMVSSTLARLRSADLDFIIDAGPSTAEEEHKRFAASSTN